jgi:hypothetical protein
LFSCRIRPEFFKFELLGKKDAGQEIKDLSREEKDALVTMNAVINKSAQEIDAAGSPFQGLVPLVPGSALRCLDLMLALPHGVQRFSPDKEWDVDTSVSFSLANLPTYPPATAGAESKNEQSSGSSSTKPNPNEFMCHLFSRAFEKCQVIPTRKSDPIVFCASLD